MQAKASPRFVGGQEAAILLAARGLRGFGDGLISLLLPVYLTRLGFGLIEIGAITTATLVGTALFTLLVGLFAHRWSQRGLLVAAGMVMCLTGAAFGVLQDFWPLLLVAFLGTLNPSAGDFSLFLPMEHARLARLARPDDRTTLFAWFSVVGTLAAAAGALAIGIPDHLAARFGADPQRFLQGGFLLYGLLGIGIAAIYGRLPREARPTGPASAVPLRASRSVVLVLAALFSLDSFAGGLVIQSLLALWLLQKFDLSIAATGVVFFWSGLLSALSYLVTVRLARRIGLVRTMVFTHVPANVCLILVPFMPTALPAVGLLMVRAFLSQMDVPARGAYVMSIVTPGERAAAASVVNTPRSLAAAGAPLLGGALFSMSAFGWPVVLAGALKILYDLLLLAMFRNRPPRAEAE